MKKIVISCFILFAFGVIWGQNRVLDIPRELKYPVEGQAIKNLDDVIPGMIWQVFSDRDDNPTYMQARVGASEKKRLKFLERFYVSDWEGDFLHLVKDPYISERGELSESQEDYGWVKMDKLLLSTHCFRTKDHINKKIAILNTINTDRKTDFSALQKDAVAFMKNPKLTQETGDKAQLFQIFFVYKKTAEAVLIGNTEKISRTDDIERTRDIIKGWVPINRVVAWDHRVALEPNWETDAAQERKLKKIRAKAFQDISEAQEYHLGKTVSKSFWDSDKYGKRNIGEWRRFPVLGKYNDNIYKVGLMGETITTIGAVDEDKVATAQRKFSEKKKELQNINIVFVVDGTSSMGRFYKPVSDALIKSIADLKQRYVNSTNPYTMRFGAVIYRDYAEKAGEGITQVRSLTRDGNQISSFLNSVVADDCCDRDKPEALYYGLKTALEQTNLKKGQTNIVILVGDAGNHNRLDPTQIGSQSVSKLLSDYSCNFLVFQVRNDGHQAYTDFATQTRTLMEQMAKQSYERDLREFGNNSSRGVAPSLEKNGNYYVLKNGIGYGRVRVASIGTQLSGSILQKEIEDAVKYSNEYTDQLLSKMYKLIVEGKDLKDVASKDESTNKYVNSFTPALMHYLKEMADGNSYSWLTKAKYQLYITGYTSTSVEGLKHPTFKPVLFVDRSGLGDVLRYVRKMNEATASAGNRRQALHDAWIEVLKAHTGDRISASELERIEVETINERVFGLPAMSDVLKGVKLNDITAPPPNGLDEVDITLIINRLEKKADDLDLIFNRDNYEYGFSSNNTSFYWIDADLFP